MKQKYLVLRRNAVSYEINDWDCYHDGNSTLAIPTEYIVELTDEEARYANTGNLIFLPILSKEEVKKEIQEQIKEAKELAKKQVEKEAKRQAAVEKRKATMAKKKKEKELAKLEELKEKYELSE